MPAFRLGLPFILLFGLGIYLTFMVDEGWAWLMVAMLVVIVAGYILSPQINWWWWQRFPPDIPQEMQQLLQRNHLFYQQLNAEEQREFRRRVFLFNQGSNYMPQVLEKAPQDIQVMIASTAVSLGFKEKEYLFPHFENIVLYPHPFPSPQYTEQFHISEIYEPDGVVMLSIEHVLRGFLDTRQFFNPAWYEYAKVFRLTYPAYDFGEWSADDWPRLQAVSGFTQAAMEKWIGLTDLDIGALAIAFYFLYPAAFREHLPKVATRYSNNFHK